MELIKVMVTPAKGKPYVAVVGALDFDPATMEELARADRNAVPDGEISAALGLAADGAELEPEKPAPAKRGRPAKK